MSYPSEQTYYPKKSYPIGWSRRRGVIIAPTTEKTTATIVFSAQYSKTWTLGRVLFKASRKRLRAVSAKERVHIDQASKEAVRLLLTLLFCS